MIVEAVLAFLVATSPASPESPQRPTPMVEIPLEKLPTVGKRGEVPATPVTTRHRITLHGKHLEYVATAGMLPVLDDAGDTQAEIFFTSYSVPQPEGAPPRPLVFAFNGGPGSSSVWLHLGALGPRRVAIDVEKGAPSQPYRLEVNRSTLLTAADLVFIDPVGTGYSRAAGKDLIGRFTSLSGDVESLGRFIRLYLTRYARWGSPLYLAGESYGTMRAAGLADYLLARGITLNGVILISCILNMQTITADQGNELPYHLALPTYAAVAWYHGRLPGQRGDLAPLLREAETFASGDYLLDLEKGNRLVGEELKREAERMARLTGLSAAFLERRLLRVGMVEFSRELLREKGEVTGRLDARLTARYLPEEYTPGLDPTLSRTKPAFTMTFNGYVRDELGFRTDREYYILGEGVGSWNWGAKNSYPDTSANLADVREKNPRMGIYVASGYFDLASPYYSARYTFDHLGSPVGASGGVTIRSYPTGHMIYLDPEGLQALRRDLGEFIAATAATLHH